MCLWKKEKKTLFSSWEKCQKYRQKLKKNTKKENTKERLDFLTSSPSHIIPKGTP